MVGAGVDLRRRLRSIFVRGDFRELREGAAQRGSGMGQDGQARPSDTRRRVAEIDESIATLDPVWRERFVSDVKRDTAFERTLLWREWAVVVVVVLFVLVRRLFV